MILCYIFNFAPSDENNCLQNRFRIAFFDISPPFQDTLPNFGSALFDPVSSYRIPAQSSF